MSAVFSELLSFVNFDMEQTSQDLHYNGYGYRSRLQGHCRRAPIKKNFQDFKE